ncbi:hypothetical protein BP6252_02429 [Coleophoma cylindrospora]|uniref:Rhodopsin domain-containing protein n=1 Tax=Coleophoma cylindrospora TaxID=1849047 RepID=A0A3D8SET3_9HELO|nr:hypothetical protein BP6252_02429 [Coleophoma cylindrospora]
MSATVDPNAGIGRGAQVIGVAVCSLCLSWITVGLRCFVRLGIQKFFGKEDWLTLVSMVFFTTLVALCLETIDFGLGRHLKDIPANQMPTGVKLIFVCELLYVATTAITKASIGLYFLRLTSRRYHKITIYTTLAVVAVFSTIYFFFILFQCSPVDYLWGFYHGMNGHCTSNTTLANVTYAHAAMSAVTDWSFGLLPVFFVWRMKMSPRTKISVILVLSLGFFASTATLVRIYYIRRLTQTPDIPYEGINLVKWSMVEPGIGITAAAIATLRPLFTTFLGSKKRQSTISSRPISGEVGDTQHILDSYRGKDSLSSEFREMLGIETGGVTTVIYAGETPAKGMAEKSWTSWFKRPGTTQERSPSSITELCEGSNDRESPAIDWNAGIMKTTIVTRED